MSANNENEKQNEHKNINHTIPDIKNIPKLSIAEVPALHSYMLSKGVRMNKQMQEMWEIVRKHKRSFLASPPEESSFLAWLVPTIGAKKVIEVGIFLGITTVAMALELPEDGKIVALEISEEFTKEAQQHWKHLGVDKKIQAIVGPAAKSLEQMVKDGESNRFDLAFIDADKENYDTYYELCLQLVRVGGIIAVDNVFWHGKVLNQSDSSSETVAIRNLNDKIHKDKRVQISIIPVADGLTLCRKL